MPLFLLLLAACKDDMGLVGIDGFPDTGILAVDCPADGELTARATNGARLLPTRLDAEGRLPVYCG